MAVHIITVLVQRLRATDEMVGDMIFLDVPARVAKKLLELAQKQDSGQGDNATTTIVLTHEELSRMVGASREVVSRTLTSYRRQGLLNTSHRKITITDVEGLERMAAL